MGTSASAGGLATQIAVREGTWKPIPPLTRGNTGWRTLECEHARGWQGSVGGMGFLHDLTHGGMTQALQMRDREGTIGAFHSTENQTRILNFSSQAVLFATMTWPGGPERYAPQINERARRTFERVASWDANREGGTPEDATPAEVG